MNSSGSVASYSLRRCSTWRAMMSRKLRPRRTHSSDLARSMPIDVPRPPLSLMTAVLRIASAASSSATSTSASDSMSSGLDRVLGDHAGLAVLEEPVVVRERVDRDLVDAGLPHLLAREVEALRRCPCLPCFDRRLPRGRHDRGHSAAKTALRDQVLAARQAAPARGRRASSRRPSPTSRSRGSRSAAPPPSRRTSRSAASPAPACCSTRCAAAGKRVLLPVRAAGPRPRLGRLRRSRRPRARGARPPRADRRRGSGVEAIAQADVVLVPGPRGLAVRRRGSARAAGATTAPCARVARRHPRRRACCTTTRSGSPCRPTPTTCGSASR